MKMILFFSSLFLGSFYAQEHTQVLKINKDRLVFSITMQNDYVISIQNNNLISYKVFHDENYEVSTIKLKYVKPVTYEEIISEISLSKNSKGLYVQNKNYFYEFLNYLGNVEGLGKR